MGDMREELRENVNNGITQSDIDKQVRDERYKEITQNVKSKELNDADLMYVVKDAVRRIVGSSMFDVSLNPRIKNLAQTPEIENLNSCILQSDVFDGAKKYLGNIGIKGENYLKVINLLKGEIDEETMTELVNNIQITGQDKESILVKKFDRIKQSADKSK